MSYALMTADVLHDDWRGDGEGVPFAILKLDDGAMDALDRRDSWMRAMSGDTDAPSGIRSRWDAPSVRFCRYPACREPGLEKFREFLKRIEFGNIGNDIAFVDAIPEGLEDFTREPSTLQAFAGDSEDVGFQWRSRTDKGHVAIVTPRFPLSALRAGLDGVAVVHGLDETVQPASADMPHG